MLLGFITSPLAHRPKQLHGCVLPSKLTTTPALWRAEVKFDVSEFGNCSHSWTHSWKGPGYLFKSNCQVFTTWTQNTRGVLPSAAETRLASQVASAFLKLDFLHSLQFWLPHSSQVPTQAQSIPSLGDENTSSIFIVNDRAAKPKITAGIWNPCFYWTN